MPISLIKSDLGLSHHEKWKLWLEKTAELRDRYKCAEDGDDPLGYNETASVSVMASAAYACGGYALAEYVSQKRTKEDLRRKGHGRDDLYAVIEGDWWVFEYKQLFCTSKTSLCKKLKDKFDEACVCAKRTDSLETRERGVAVLIVYIMDDEGDVRKDYAKTIIDFAKANKDLKFAACLDECISKGQCFIMFSDPL